MSKRKWIWIAVGLGILLCLVAPLSCLWTSALLLSPRSTTPPVWGDVVAMVRVEGTLVSGKEEDWLLSDSGNVYSESIIEQLQRADSSPSVKAIVLRVNSPGGGVVASDEIYHALLELETPVVVSMSEVAASGGYYISCGADEIVANPTTLTGSIGVIGTSPNLEGLLDKIGIQVTVIKSGDMKDALSPFREPTEEELEYYQKIIDEAYAQFVGIVAEGRGLPPDQVREIADGRVYTGLQALELGLVDELGNFPEAIDLAAELGGIEGEPQVIDYGGPPSLMDILLGAVRRLSPPVSVDEFLGIEQHFTIKYLYVRP
jgi:protease-4